MNQLIARVPDAAVVAVHHTTLLGEIQNDAMTATGPPEGNRCLPAAAFGADGQAQGLATERWPSCGHHLAGTRSHLAAATYPLLGGMRFSYMK